MEVGWVDNRRSRGGRDLLDSSWIVSPLLSKHSQFCLRMPGHWRDFLPQDVRSQGNLSDARHQGIS